MYHLTQTQDGYTGLIQGKPQFKMKLILTDEKASNKYISGTQASLMAVFPDLLESSGVGQIATQPNDRFACGKQIADFGS